MKIGKSCTDRFVHLESTAGSEKLQLRWSKWIFLAELEDPVVEASSICTVKAMQTKVEVEYSFAGHPGLLQRIGTESRLLFLQSQQYQFGILSHLVTIDNLNINIL